MDIEATIQVECDALEEALGVERGWMLSWGVAIEMNRRYMAKPDRVPMPDDQKFLAEFAIGSIAHSHERLHLNAIRHAEACGYKREK